MFNASHIYHIGQYHTIIFQSSVIEFHILFKLPSDYFCKYIYFMVNHSLVYIFISCFIQKHQVRMEFPNNVKNYMT